MFYMFFLKKVYFWQKKIVFSLKIAMKRPTIEINKGALV